MPSTPETILDELLRHRPVPNSAVKRSVIVRWVGTVVIGAMAPLGLYVGFTGTTTLLPITGWVAVALSAGGMLAVASGWMARRRHGLDGQWGFAPLVNSELEEFSAIANTDVDLGEVVDLWVSRCMESGANLRGRDLMFLRKKARLYLKGRGLTLPSISPRL